MPKNGHHHANRRGWLALRVSLLLLAGVAAPAQEALQNSLKGQTAAESRDRQIKNPDYTVKYGDFRALVSPSLGTEWNDNVNLSETNAWDDVIIKPSVGVVSSYQITQRNLLFLDVSIGYDRYLNHPSLSTFDLNSASGTGLSFDLGLKDVTLNFHDWMTYVQDSAQSGQVANTGNYGTFENTAGLSAFWELNQISLSAGYDHRSVIATSAEFDDISHTSEMVFLRSGLRVHPRVTLGAEVTAAYTTYDKHQLNDNDAYTAGAFAEFRPDSFLRVTVRGGYSTYQFQQTSQSIETSSQNSWYASLNVNHQATDAVSYTLDAGHEVQLGTESDLTEVWYVRPTVAWNIIKGWDCGTGFFYEHGDQGIGNVTGNYREKYDWYGGQLSLRHSLTRCLAVSAYYRLTQRTSDQPDNGYTQNLVGLQLTYQFK